MKDVIRESNPSGSYVTVSGAGGSGPFVPGSGAAEFEILALTKSVSNVNFNTFVADLHASAYLGFARASSGAQNDEVVLRLPFVLAAGTWALVLSHRGLSSGGIYTVSCSPDAVSWTDLTTIDGYNASGTGVATRTEVTGLTVAAGINYMRLKMATKNASSSNYFGRWDGLFGLRTGA